MSYEMKVFRVFLIKYDKWKRGMTDKQVLETVATLLEQKEGLAI